MVWVGRALVILRPVIGMSLNLVEADGYFIFGGRTIVSFLLRKFSFASNNRLLMGSLLDKNASAISLMAKPQRMLSPHPI